MRLPYALVIVNGEVLQVDPRVRNGSFEPWAVELSIVTEPDGGVLRVNAHMEDGFSTAELDTLLGKSVELLVALTARPGRAGTPSEGRAFLNARLAAPVRVLSTK